MKINLLIPKRNPQCALNGETFKEGEHYVSLLAEKESSSFERKDYCLACWKKIDKDSSGHIWQGKIPKKNLVNSNSSEKAVQFLRKLLQSHEDVKLLYVLSELLVRKKLLCKLKNEYYELPVTGEVFHIKTFILKPEEAESLAAQIAENIL